MIYKDPINGKEIPVRSVYVPKQTLLQGRPFDLNNYWLMPRQASLVWVKK